MLRSWIVCLAAAALTYTFGFFWLDSNYASRAPFAPLVTVTVIVGACGYFVRKSSWPYPVAGAIAGTAVILAQLVIGFLVAGS